MAYKLCRFCLKEEKVNHSVSIFSPQSVSREDKRMLGGIFEVQIEAGDGMPGYACRGCYSAAKRVNSKLQELRRMAHASYDRFSRVVGLTTENPVPLQPHNRLDISGMMNILENESILGGNFGRVQLGGDLGCGDRVGLGGGELQQQQKRRKDTSSGDGVSPMTLKAQPPRKRRSGVGRQLLFSEPATLDDTASASLLENMPMAVATEYHPAPLVEHSSSNMNATVSSTSCPVSLGTSLHEIVGKAFHGGKLGEIIQVLFDHDLLQGLLIEKVISVINDECLDLCRRSEPSMFRHSHPIEYVDFKWSKYIADLESRSPVLLQLCRTLVSHSDHRNEKKEGSTHVPAICMAVSVLLKERNREMVGLQTCISMLLYASRAEKQVFTRLNHVGVALSYTATLEVVTIISELHKAPLKELLASSTSLIKFIGDNLDTHRGVRDIRSDHRGSLVHMYSLLAVHTRVPVSSLATTGTSEKLHTREAASFLPTRDDVQQMKRNLTVLTSKILCDYIQCLQPLAKYVPQHIPHQYYSEMSKTSETWFLDVLMKNEAKHSDMVDIMTTMQNYLGDDFPSTAKVLSGGDQLTCERQFGAQRHLMDGDTPEERLQLLEPVCEDWHALMCFLKVLWRRLVKASSKDHGTFGYFCSLLGRYPNAKNPKKDMNACMDVLFTVIKGHYVAYGCQLLGISGAEESCDVVATLKGRDEKIAFLAKISHQVMQKFSINDKAVFCEVEDKTGDAAYDYARVFCHFASLALEFKDSWDEGDGDRSIRCWKFFLLHFRASNCTKYAWEALRLQFQLIVLPPSLSHQVKWERFVNVHGGAGKNIPCDLFNEHMNKLFKDVIASMGANLTEKAVQRAARSVSTLARVKDAFDKQSGVVEPTRAHSLRSNVEDVNKVVDVLLKNRIMEPMKGRELTQFKNFNQNPLAGLNWKQLPIWINKKKKQMITLKYAVGEGSLSDSDATDIGDSTDEDNSEDN